MDYDGEMGTSRFTGNLAAGNERAWKSGLCRTPDTPGDKTQRDDRTGVSARFTPLIRKVTRRTFISGAGEEMSPPPSIRRTPVTTVFYERR